MNKKEILALLEQFSQEFNPYRIELDFKSHQLEPLLNEIVQFNESFTHNIQLLIDYMEREEYREFEELIFEIKNNSLVQVENLYNSLQLKITDTHIDIPKFDKLKSAMVNSILLTPYNLDSRQINPTEIKTILCFLLHQDYEYKKKINEINISDITSIVNILNILEKLLIQSKVQPFFREMLGILREIKVTSVN